MIPIRYIVVAACVAATAVWYVRQPARTRVPDKLMPVAGVRAQFEKLEPRERTWVAGYLLRQRGEVLSLHLRDEGPFTARTFGDAIKLQRAFLQAQSYSATSLVRIGLEDQALRPLREAVELVGIEASTTTRRQMFNIHPGYATRHGGANAVAEEDRPLLKVTYILRNLTDREVEVSGAVDVRKASPLPNDRGMLTSCYIKKATIAPRMRHRVDCADVNGDYLSTQSTFLRNGTERDWHLIWTPREIVFADGRTLTYNENTAAKGKLWDFYALEQVD